MGKKRDTKQIDSIAKKFHMTGKQRKDFGKFVEDEKANGWGGSLNERGDFTYAELNLKIKEFLELSN